MTQRDARGYGITTASQDVVMSCSSLGADHRLMSVAYAAGNRANAIDVLLLRCCKEQYKVPHYTPALPPPDITLPRESTAPICPPRGTE